MGIADPLIIAAMLLDHIVKTRLSLSLVPQRLGTMHIAGFKQDRGQQVRSHSPAEQSGPAASGNCPRASAPPRPKGRWRAQKWSSKSRSASDPCAGTIAAASTIRACNQRGLHLVWAQKIHIQCVIDRWQILSIYSFAHLQIVGGNPWISIIFTCFPIPLLNESQTQAPVDLMDHPGSRGSTDTQIASPSIR